MQIGELTNMKRLISSILLIFLSSSIYAADREVAIVSSASPAAEWVHFSGPSPAAEWIHFSGPSPAAKYVFITDDCEKSSIELLNSSPSYADWVFISGPSPAADWIFLSGPSPAADWYYITDKESMAEITLCIPEKEMRTKQNVAILLHLFKKGK